MLYETNTYAAFMMDRASGALGPAELMAADLHIALSPEGRTNAWMWDALGGAFLEDQLADDGEPHRLDIMGAENANEESLHASRFVAGDLSAQKWRRNLWGAKTAPTGIRNAKLLRMDPGVAAPRHGHHRSDVTVVLEGAFADEFGLYERGDISFGEPGHHHQPRAIGDKPCICFVATEPRRPVLTKWFGLGGAKS